MDITHDLSINASPETIYNAVSSQEGINNWWAKEGNVGTIEGAASTLKFNKEGKIVEMGFRTQTLIPHQKVVWECTANPNPAWLGTTISTEISPDDNGASKVVFSHAGFDEKWAGQDPFEMTKGGWEHFIGSLVSYCETGVGQPW